MIASLRAGVRPISRLLFWRLILRIESVMGKTAIGCGGLDEARSSNSPLSWGELLHDRQGLYPCRSIYKNLNSHLVESEYISPNYRKQLSNSWMSSITRGRLP
jgi:hypothetical protein